MQDIKDYIFDHLGYVTNTNVIQLGCGDGRYLAQLAKEAPCKLVGVAYTEGELARCKSSQRLRGVDIVRVNTVDKEATTQALGKELYETAFCLETPLFL
jgi:cyclopropane fatty-acyl-phospholipid synthase-like methyltransferase